MPRDILGTETATFVARVLLEIIVVSAFLALTGCLQTMP